MEIQNFTFTENALFKTFIVAADVEVLDRLLGLSGWTILRLYCCSSKKSRLILNYLVWMFGLMREGSATLWTNRFILTIRYSISALKTR